MLKCDRDDTDGRISNDSEYNFDVADGESDSSDNGEDAGTETGDNDDGSIR